MTNRILSPKRFAYHLLLLFYLFRYEQELLSGFPPLHQNKLQEQGLQKFVNIKKIEFEPSGNLINQVYSKFIETLINNQGPLFQTENDETPEAEIPH